ncbi:MAG: hypothetical protein MPN21_17260 [Thermoanaerobaculia bacterium]|nr:hypothetical protein [Thermoanaerobaculia bacterium]
MSAIRLPPPTWLWWLAGGWFLVAAAYWSGHQIDDTFISLRYARNLAEGHGLVFNPGERVEGYTNFLWVMLAAGAFRIDIDALLAMRALSAMAAVGLFVLIWRTDRAAAVLVSSLPAVAFWSVTGMESMFFASLLFLAWALLWRESTAVPPRWIRGSSFVFLLLALTRPEGVPLFALCHGLVWAAEGFDVRALRRHLIDSAGFVVSYGAYFVWRYSYYGELFPNTYYAKVTGGAEQWMTGLRSLADWAFAHPAFGLALLAVPLLAAIPRTRREIWGDRRTLALWGLCSAYSAYVVSVGGDFMPFFRFFLPLAPFFALLTARLLGLLPSGRSRMVALCAVFALQAITGLWNDQPERAFVAHRTSVVGSLVGKTLADLYEPDDLLAVNTAGSLPFAARMPTIDMLGLTDSAIARHPVFVVSTGWAGHRRGWGEYVVSRRPKAVLWYNSAGLAEPHYLGDHQLADDPFFRFFYQRRGLVSRIDGEEEGEELDRFIGWPFHGDGEGTDSNTPSQSPELGASFEAVRYGGVLRFTVARAADVHMVWFERRDDPDDLWSLIGAADRDVDRFLDLVIERWRSVPADPFDPEARAEAEALARQAARAAQDGDEDRAKELLTAASRRSGARSPLVYQYIANLAAMDGDIFLAVQAQREALRLQPENQLYRRNLAALLDRPFGASVDPHIEAL